MKELNKIEIINLSETECPVHNDESLECVFKYSNWQPLLSQAYLAVLPTTRRLWGRVLEYLPGELSDEQQKVMNHLVLSATIYHRLALKYPRDNSHSLASLIWLQETFQERVWNTDAIDPFIACFRNIIHELKQPELSYKTYLFEESSVSRYDNIKINIGVLNYFETDNLLINNVFDDKFLSNNEKLEDDYVSLLESVEGIAHNTTGLTSWGGSAVMTQWIDSNIDILRGKRVLELGSGVGYLASVILKNSIKLKTENHDESEEEINKNHLPNPSQVEEGLKSYTATDCHPHVLETLHHNLMLADKKESWSYSKLKDHRQNLCDKLKSEEIPAGSDPSEHPWTPSVPLPPIGGITCQVQYLDWRVPDYAVIPSCDLIIAADVVYALHLMAPLTKLIRGILSRSSADECSKDTPEGSTDTPVAYIACTRRNSDTMSSFLTLLREEGLSYTLVYQATLDTQSALFVYNMKHYELFLL